MHELADSQLQYFAIVFNPYVSLVLICLAPGAIVWAGRTHVLLALVVRPLTTRPHGRSVGGKRVGVKFRGLAPDRRFYLFRVVLLALKMYLLSRSRFKFWYCTWVCADVVERGMGGTRELWCALADAQMMVGIGCVRRCAEEESSTCHSTRRLASEPAESVLPVMFSPAAENMSFPLRLKTRLVCGSYALRTSKLGVTVDVSNGDVTAPLCLSLSLCLSCSLSPSRARVVVVTNLGGAGPHRRGEVSTRGLVLLVFFHCPRCGGRGGWSSHVGGEQQHPSGSSCCYPASRSGGGAVG